MQQSYSKIHPAALATGLTQCVRKFKTQMTQERPLFSREGFRYGSGRPVTLANVIDCCQRIDFIHVFCSHCPTDEAELRPVCFHSYGMVTPSCIEQTRLEFDASITLGGRYFHSMIFYDHHLQIESPEDNMEVRKSLGSAFLL